MIQLGGYNQGIKIMDDKEMKQKKSLFVLPYNSRSIIFQLKLPNFKFKVKK